MPDRPDEALTYRSAGIDYDVLDAAKRIAGAEAAQTVPGLRPPGWSGVEASRGNTAYVFEQAGGQRMATVLECLGTKSVLAREVSEQTGFEGFEAIGYDAVSSVVNDLVCVGALPLVINAYFATGTPSWYANTRRMEDLTRGWRKACQDSGAIWGGGESPSLPGMIADGDIEIAGSGVGTIPGEAILGDRLAAGDECVLVASSGLHTNGASLARMVAGREPEGYATKLPSGAPFGEALLTPSYIYVELVAALTGADLPVTFLSHITGHGLRKIMRAKTDLTYRLSALPPVPEVLTHLVQAAGMDDREAYGTLNMGAGMAVFVRPGHAQAVVDLAAAAGLDAIVAGGVEAGPRQVVLEPLDVVFGTDELALS